MFTKIKKILPSGFGLKISNQHFNSLTSRQIKMLIGTSGFLIIEDVDYHDEEKFMELTKSYGSVIEYTGDKEDVGFGYRDLLKLDGEKGKIVTGRGELSLHADGGLLNSKVDIVLFYAHKIKNLKFQGATTFCDHESAYRDMPLHIKKVLDNEVFEYLITDKKYYASGSPENWFSVPLYVDYGWCRKMLIYLPFKENNPPSWKSRVVGFTKDENSMFFNELKDFMTQSKYYYRHYWSENDLIIFDNRRALHARESFDEESTRVIFRGQVEDTY